MSGPENDFVQAFAPRVVYEDNHYVVVNKLPSEIVQEYIRLRYEKPGAAFLGVAHRIDRPVSGLVIFARTSKGLARINALLQKREVQKTYWAVVKDIPVPGQGQLVHFLARNEKQNKSYAVSESAPGAKRAVLNYRLLATGCPIKGDLKYGSPRSNENGSIHLHARSVGFVHPVNGERIDLVAPVPPGDPLWAWFEQAVAGKPHDTSPIR